MSLTYTTYVEQLSNMMVVGSTTADFQTFLPGCIDYAEQRIYRELDLIHTQVTDAGTQVSSGNRDFILPTTLGTFITVDQINIISPAATASSIGSRIPLTPVERSLIDMVYPSGQAQTSVPEFYSRVNSSAVIFGPAPDAAYFAEVIGTQRPTPLSSTNTTTILTEYIPDVFMAASMVFAFGYMRDFGAQSDNPQAAQSWENQYKSLMQSASVEQARVQFESQGWTSKQPSQIATPPRV